MTGLSRRMGLVVGARWHAAQMEQGHITEAAELLAAALFDPALGACEPALDGVPVLRDPTLDELTDRVEQAFAAASDSGSTLVICLVGHGYRTSSPGRFCFLPCDYPGSHDDPERYGYALAERIAELNGRYGGTDGLILLIDACRSGNLWRPGERDLSLPLPRLAVATATGSGPAWGSRFSRVVSEGMESGISGAGHFLKVGDFGPLLARLLTESAGHAQPAHHFAHDESDDEGLWLSVNRAVRASQIETLVWEVTRHRGLYRITDRFQRPEIPDLVADSIAANRMVAVLGPSGCGKSATLQIIAIDGLDPARIGDARREGEAWQGVAFFPAAADSTADQFATHVYDQLDRCSHGEFKRAADRFVSTLDDEDEARLTSIERWLTGPLKYLTGPASVLLVVDGLDQLPPDAADGILDCLSQLADADQFGHVRVVASARYRPDHAQPRLPAGFTPVTMPAPSSRQVRRYLERRRIPEARLTEVESVAAGNWLIITLLCNGLANQPDRTGGLPSSREALYNELLSEACSDDQRRWVAGPAQVMAVLTCAGAGVALPLTVLCEASGELGGPGAVAAVRNSIVALNRVVERVEPGTDGEHVLLIHPTLVEHLSSPLNTYPIPPLSQAHSAVAAALARLAPMGAGGTGGDPARDYANRSEATHRWEAGDYAGAVAVLIGRPSPSARENRDRWTSWTERIAVHFGPDDLLTLEARQQLAFWTSRCGLYTDALRLYGELMPLVTSRLGTDAPLTLRVAFDEAMCSGVNGNTSQARDQLRVLEPRVAQTAGPFAELTLEVRHAVGSWTGLAGQPREAVTLLRPVLHDCHAHLGPDHPETLACRNSLARWTGEAGEPSRAVEEFRALLPAQTRRLGATHRETLRTRYSIAYWSGESGRPAETLQLMNELISVQREALGDEHPDTLRTLHGIGLWTGVTGDPAEAVRILDELLPVRERVLGRDHPDTLRTLNNLGRWTGALGQYDRAIDLLEDTLERRTRTLGAEHPDTMRTVNNIVDLTGAAGHYRQAYERATELLPLQQRVLGDGHQDTMRTRFNQARWLAADGQPAAALDQLRALHRDQVTYLGEQHPDAHRTARAIEELTAGDQSLSATPSHQPWAQPWRVLP